MLTIEQLEKKFREGIGNRRGPVTIEAYCQSLRRLCIATKKTEWTRDDLLKYFDKLIGKGFAPRTIVTYYYSIKAVHRYLKIPFPLEADDLPRGQARPRNNPVVRTPDIKVLIDYVKASGNIEEKFFLCLSTIYGFRRVEMAKLIDSSFTFRVNDESTFYVEAAKHGVSKDQLIPKFVEPYLRPMIGRLPVGTNSLTFLWNSLCKNAGYATKKNEGWHAIRRSLVTELGEPELGFRDSDILTFMRWSQEGSMVARYTNAVDPLKIDRKIFEKHPFLKYWE